MGYTLLLALHLVSAEPSVEGSATTALPIVVLGDDPPGPNRSGTATFVDSVGLTARGSMPVGPTPSEGAYEPGANHLWVLNNGSMQMMNYAMTDGSLSVVDASSRTLLREIPLEDGPSILFVGSGDRPAVVLCVGTKAKGPSATFLDRTSLEPIRRTPLGPGLWVGELPESHIAAFSPSGRSLFVVRAPRSHNPMVPLKPPVAGAPRGESSIVFVKAQTAPSQLTLLDAATGEVRTQLTLGARCNQMASSEDGKLLYVLCGGHFERKKAGKDGQQGKVYTLDAETGAVVSAVDAGFDPPSFERLSDGGLLVLARRLGQHPPRVLVLKPAGVTELALPSDPVQVVSAPRSLARLVLCERHVVQVDATFARIERTVDLPFDAAQLLVPPGGSSAWIASADSSQVAAVALEPGGPLKVLTSGRAGVKAGKAIGSALSFLGSFVVELGSAVVGGHPSPSPIVGYVPPAAKPLMALSADGSLLFVVNHKSEDVTTIDVASHRILAKTAIGNTSSASVFPLPSGRRALVITGGHTSVVSVDDAGTVSARSWNSISGGPVDARLRPGAQELWILRKGGVEIFDLAAAEMRAELKVYEPLTVVFPPE